MSDWTGVNLTEVTTNLANFEAEANSITSDFATAYTVFDSTLYEAWASPRAVEFNRHLETIALVYNETVDALYTVLCAAGIATQEMAQYNGATFSNPYQTIPAGKKFTEYQALRSDIGGTEGMNIALVNSAYDTFYDQIVNVDQRLRGLPTAFGLYDPSGELQGAYQELINKAITQVEDAINAAIPVINDAIHNEVNQVEFGKTAAETELGGGEGTEGGGETTKEKQPMTPLGEHIGERYSTDWQQFIDGWNEKWKNTSGVIGAIGNGLGSAVEVVNMAADGVIDSVLVVPDTVTYLLNGLCDVASPDGAGLKTGQDYFNYQIQHDFYENWDMVRNAENFWQGALGVVVGTGETVVDGLQTAVNAIDVALDWTGNALSDAFNWVGGWFN